MHITVHVHACIQPWDLEDCMMGVRFRGESDGASWARGIPVIGPRNPHSQPELSRCTKLRCAFLEPLHKPSEIFGTFLPFGLCV
jgi:hypothetical protein